MCGESKKEKVFAELFRPSLPVIPLLRQRADVSSQWAECKAHTPGFWAKKGGKPNEKNIVSRIF